MPECVGAVGIASNESKNVLLPLATFFNENRVLAMMVKASLHWNDSGCVCGGGGVNSSLYDFGTTKKRVASVQKPQSTPFQSHFHKGPGSGVVYAADVYFIQSG